MDSALVRPHPPSVPLHAQLALRPLLHSFLLPIFILLCAASSALGQSSDYFDSSGIGVRRQQPTDPRQQTPPFQQGGAQPRDGQSPFAFGQQSQQQQQQQRGIGGSTGGQQNPFGQLGRANSNGTWPRGMVYANSPLAHKNSTSHMIGQQQTIGDGRGNVQVEVHLHSFANPGFRLPDGRLCTCPAANQRCVDVSPQRNGYNCLTSLSVFVLSSDDEFHLEETPYFPLNAAGQLGQQELGQRAFQFQLDTEPSAIGIMVHNLGPQINMDGSLYETNTVTTVDTFVQPLTGPTGGGAFSPSYGGGMAPGQQQNVKLQGKLIGTQLGLGFSVSCRGARSTDGRSSLVGPGCDLACNSSAANPTTATCQSQRTGFFSLCRWTNGNSQVTDCKQCPWGIRENAYCADEQGGVLEPTHAGVVSSFYYSAFIVLCCVCALLLLCMIVACLLSILRMRRRSDGPLPLRRPPQARPAVSGTATNTLRGDPERAALTSAACPPAADDSGGFAAFRLGPDDGKGPPPYSSRSNGSATSTAEGTVRAVGSSPNPLPLPRSNTSTASAASGGAMERHRFPPPLAIGTKAQKSLSPPRFQPLPHLGPSVHLAGGNDSLNSSFAGLPPPSVSADV